MSYEPSQRIKKQESEELNLNLNPMMDMFAVLIPALLMMSAVVDAVALDVAAPSGDDQPPPVSPPLGLRLTVTSAGYVVTSREGAAPAGHGGSFAPLIPLVQTPVACTRYRGIRPPPRERNRDFPPCGEAGTLTAQTFWVYDAKALQDRLRLFKEAYATERTIIIEGSVDSEFEAIVDAMDAARSYRAEDGRERPLFPEVVVGAAPNNP